MVVSIDVAWGFKEWVTTLVEPCNLLYLEGTFRKPYTMQAKSHRERVTLTSAQFESSHSVTKSYTTI